MPTGCLQGVCNGVGGVYYSISAGRGGARPLWWPAVGVSTVNFQKQKQGFSKKKQIFKWRGPSLHFGISPGTGAWSALTDAAAAWRLTHQQQVIRGWRTAADASPGPLILRSKHPHTIPDTLEATSTHRRRQLCMQLHCFTQNLAFLQKFTFF